MVQVKKNMQNNKCAQKFKIVFYKYNQTFCKIIL